MQYVGIKEVPFLMANLNGKFVQGTPWANSGEDRNIKDMRAMMMARYNAFQCVHLYAVPSWKLHI